MVKTKLALIQDDILAVKHALANNLSFEGLEGEQLNNVLQTLLAQRAEAATTAEATSGSASTSTASSSGSGSCSNSDMISRVPVNGARPKVVAAKKGTGKNKAPASTSSSKTPDTTPSRTAPPTAKTSAKRAKAPAPEQRRQASSGKPAKKPRASGSHDRLRQLRKSIKIGDTLSVLMDVSVRGSWEKGWVEGEVVQEVRKDGYIHRATDETYRHPMHVAVVVTSGRVYALCTRPVKNDCGVTARLLYVLLSVV